MDSVKIEVKLYFTIAPNPINGCLCEILLTCTCVATHLQDFQEDGSGAYNFSPAASSCCSSSPQIPETIIAPPTSDIDLLKNPLFPKHSLADQQAILNHNFIPTNDADVSELLIFLKNDLDKYLSPSPI